VPGDEAAIALDVAATQLRHEEGYRLAAEDRVLSAAELAAELARWCADFPIVSVEDPLGEDDEPDWALAAARFGGLQLVGDDRFATDAGRVARGIAAGSANAVLVKPNQCGTLTGARRVVEQARAAGWATVLSARSGETEDAWLADLAVGWGTGQLKVGSTTRSERTAKWNRLLRIEAEEPSAVFAGRSVLAGGGG
jgi:enolase